MQDPTQFYRDEAQLMYQRQFTEGRYVASKNDAQYVSYWDSLKSMVDQSPPKPKDYRSFSADRLASGYDLAGRSVAMGGQLIESTGELLAMEVAGELAMKTLGLSGGLVGGIAAMYAYDKATTHYGVKDAIGQFRDIEDIRFASGDFMAKAHADPVTGRISRDGAKRINDYLVDYSRLANAFDPDASSLDETKAKVARLTDLGLLDNVKGAEDFAEKFSKLNEGLLKMSEALGKSFEDAASTLAKLKRMNIASGTGASIAEDIRALGTTGGLDFDTVMNAALQGATMTMGTGIGPRAGAKMGAQGAAMASLMYQRYGDNPEYERFWHRMGGEEGLRQFSTQAPMRLITSSWADLMLAQSFDASTGDVDKKTLMEYLTGDRSVLGGGLDLDAEGVISFEANRNKIIDELLADDPMTIKAMALSQGLNMAQASGLEFSDEASVHSYIGGVLGISKDEVKAMAMELQASSMGRGQAEAEEIAIGRGRLEGRGDWEMMGLGRLWGGSEMNAMLTENGRAWSEYFRDSFWGVAEDWRVGMHYRATGQVKSMVNRSNQEVVNMALEAGGIQPEVAFGGMMYSRRGNDATDTMHALSRLGILNEGFRFGITQDEYKKQRISRGVKFYERMGRFRGMEGKELELFASDHADQDYTLDEFGKLTKTFVAEGNMEDDIAVRALKRGLQMDMELVAYDGMETIDIDRKARESAREVAEAVALGTKLSDLSSSEMDTAEAVLKEMKKKLGSAAKLTPYGRMLIGEPVAGGEGYRQALRESLDRVGVTDDERMRVTSAVFGVHQQDGGMAEIVRHAQYGIHGLISKDGKTLLDTYDNISDEFRKSVASGYFENNSDVAFSGNLKAVLEMAPDIDKSLAHDIASEMSMGRNFSEVMKRRPDLRSRVRQDDHASRLMLRSGGMFGMRPGWANIKARTSLLSDELKYASSGLAEEGIDVVAKISAGAELELKRKREGLTEAEDRELRAIRSDVANKGFDSSNLLDILGSNPNLSGSVLAHAAQQEEPSGSAQEETGGASLVNERILEELKRMTERNQNFNALLVAKMDTIVANSRR